MADRLSTARGDLGIVRALVLAVDTDDPRRPIQPELDELAALAAASGATVVETVVQGRRSVDPGTLVGSGKALEIAATVEERGIDLVIVFNGLRPRQRRNLEKIIPAPIIDRTMLILDVFARHARSSEGQMQVELAQLRYRQSNLIGTGTDLSRLGGGIGTRGPGETQLEVDRRRIGQRIDVLRSRLDQVRRQRATRRGGAGGEPIIALVGYTNAGKSSLLNRLAGSNAFVADQPFATLDPMMRRVWLGTGTYARLVDTVGFITELPADLINAFRATLEELGEADVLVHVVDGSSTDWPRQMEAVDATLAQLELNERPRLVVFNKADLSAAGAPPDGRVLKVSAQTGEGIDGLRDHLASLIG